MITENEIKTETDKWANPAGTDGFEFLEFASHDTDALKKLFLQLGFTATSRDPQRGIIRFQQGDINFLLNERKGEFARQFESLHGPCACSFGLRVKNTEQTMDHLYKQGATIIQNPEKAGLPYPAIEGIGKSRLYLIDTYGANGFAYENFEPLTNTNTKMSNQLILKSIDHITHNVHRGRLNFWAKFYERLFNFREIRYFDISGEYTGLFSRAMTAPCGKARIPINESSDDNGQIAEYLKQYNGEGIQHIALATDDIYTTVETLKKNNLPFMTAPPETYYDMLEERLPGHKENIKRMQSNGILMDGSDNKHLLLQIFTETVIGPIFFEIIQRKGDDGFGEGNFTALFESMERDQIRRGVLQVAE